MGSGASASRPSLPLVTVPTCPGAPSYAGHDQIFEFLSRGPTPLFY